MDDFTKQLIADFTDSANSFCGVFSNLHDDIRFYDVPDYIGFLQKQIDNIKLS